MKEIAEAVSKFGKKEIADIEGKNNPQVCFTMIKLQSGNVKINDYKNLQLDCLYNVQPF